MIEENQIKINDFLLRSINLPRIPWSIIVALGDLLYEEKGFEVDVVDFF
jgi:hypothetical protein